MTAFRPTLIIRESGFPESGKFLPVKSGILGIGIRNATNDWNPESKFHWQRLESGTWNSAKHARLCNVSVKSKLQHAPPGHLTFLKIIVQIPPYPGQNAVQMPHTGVHSGDQMPHPGDISQAQKWQKDSGNAFSCRTKSL